MSERKTRPAIPAVAIELRAEAQMLRIEIPSLNPHDCRVVDMATGEILTGIVGIKLDAHCKRGCVVEIEAFPGK